jgi:hypothetical protein
MKQYETIDYAIIALVFVCMFVFTVGYFPWFLRWLHG